MEILKTTLRLFLRLSKFWFLLKKGEWLEGYLLGLATPSFRLPTHCAF